MLKFLASLVLAVIALSAVPNPVAADSGPGNQQELRVEGMITGINLATGQVAITTRGGVKVVVVAVAGTKIERNGLHVPLAAFRLGDAGQARFLANGVATKIQAVGP